MSDDKVTLTINGTEFADWTDTEISTGLKDCASAIEMPVSERWAGRTPPTPWQIKPFDSVTASIGGETVMTGYIERYDPSYTATNHNVRTAGRSKTCDLIDCMPDVGSGEFNGYKLDAIARKLAAAFGINVVVECDVGDALPDATIEKTETAFSFLEKLSRLRSVLITDNEKGDLVLTNAGKGGDAAGALIEGENILSASARLSSQDRFKTYVVLSQTPLAYDDQDVQYDILGTATDPGCPRPRRFAEMAENPSDDALAKKRATWRALHNCAEGTQAEIVVQGFRQPDGKLWKKNQLVLVRSPRLAIDRKLLIANVRFGVSSGGSVTRLTVAPQEAFTPEPSENVNGKSAVIWSDAIPIKGK